MSEIYVAGIIFTFLFMCSKVERDSHFSSVMFGVTMMPLLWPLTLIVWCIASLDADE